MSQFEFGDRVFVNHRSGFSRGSYGVVNHVVGNYVHVIRDGSKTSVYFHIHELDLVKKATKKNLFEKYMDNTFGNNDHGVWGNSFFEEDMKKCFEAGYKYGKGKV